MRSCVICGAVALYVVADKTYKRAYCKKHKSYAGKAQTVRARDVDKLMAETSKLFDKLLKR
jgi:hypothetical protein